MSRYINQRATADNKAEGTSTVFPMMKDLSGTLPYISHEFWPTTGFTYSNFESKYDASSVTGTVQSSGTVSATPIYLPGNFLVSNLSMVTGTTTASALTHRWYALADANLKIVASTADDTTAVPSVSTIHTLAIATAGGVASTTYRIPSTAVTNGYEGAPTLYYFLSLFAGSTICSVANQQAPLAMVSAVPKNGVTDQTGKSVPLATDSSVTVSIATPAITVPLVGVS